MPTALDGRTHRPGAPNDNESEAGGPVATTNTPVVTLQSILERAAEIKAEKAKVQTQTTELDSGD